MRKTLVCIALAIVMALSLVSCSQTTLSAEHLEDYVFTIQYHDNFNILQLTDIHWNATSSTVASKAYLDKLLKEANDHIVATQGAGAKIDLVELTGDMSEVFTLDDIYVSGINPVMVMGAEQLPGDWGIKGMEITELDSDYVEDDTDAEAVEEVEDLGDE